MMNHVIEVRNLRKTYGSVTAVKDISFSVRPGELFAFLGPNGAGKSTTMNMICTFLKPDSGSVFVNGYQLGKEDQGIRQSIGAVFQESLLDKMLTVEENLMLRGSFYIREHEKLTAAVKNAEIEANVVEFKNRPYGKLSGGQKRRADIARALIHTPNILFLDEPTTGLDPQTRKSVWENIKKLQKEKGMTVFLTTHYMEEAEEADYCVVIDHGEIAAEGTPFDLKDRYSKDRIQLKSDDQECILRILGQLGYSGVMRPGYIEVFMESTLEAIPILEHCKAHLKEFSVRKGSMDDAFIGITGKEIREV